MKNICVVVLTVFVFASSSSLAGEPHLLLDIVPVIAATVPPALDPMKEISKLSGDWYFTVHYSGTSPEDRQFRFYQNTIGQLDQTIYIIEGNQFSSDFKRAYTYEVGGAYESQLKFYTVESLWGPPDYDLGSAYIFKSIDRDTPGFDCHYFTDGQGHIKKYYKGFGGTLDCEPLTKRRRVVTKMKQSSAFVDLEHQKEAVWARHLDNVRRNALQKSKALPVLTQLLPIQSTLNTVVEQFGR